MKKISLLIPAVIFILIFQGCATSDLVFENIDKEIINKAIGKKYSDLTGETDGIKFHTDFGDILTSANLNDGSIIFIHVIELDGWKSNWFGLFGRIKKIYKINVFKVMNNIVEDWAYGVYRPEKKGWLFLISDKSITIKLYNSSPIFDKIKINYENMVQTSGGKTILSWK